ncbi:MAG: amino acid adenylation domain-containing protein, partial [Ferruginibacter sp.]
SITVVNTSQINIGLSYNKDLLDELYVKQIREHIEHVLHQVINNAEGKLSDISIITPARFHQLLVTFNDTYSAYPKEKSIIDLFEEQVANTPSATAIVFEGESITYQQLSERSNQLANYLSATPIRPGANIGLLSYRGIDMIVAMLGIVKAGCAYVPFNTEYPGERLNFIIEDAAIAHVVYTSHELLQSKALNGLSQIHINDAADSSTASPAVEIPANAFLYVMFTSGTTGRPKGIGVNHQNVVKLVYDKGPISVLPSDRVLQWSNYSFDGSTYDIYSSLLKGATLCLISDNWAADADQLSRVMNEQQITVCFITTALFNTFIDVHPDSLKGIRKILFGGEMVSSYHVKKALSVLGGGKIVHVYGPTETTTYASSYPIDKVEEGMGIPIGKPLSNSQFYVLDGHRQLVPVGVPGELYIGGDGVSTGYVNNVELTRERFIINPFTNKANDKIYRTGDIVKWLPDGNIEYLGRIDDQVKIRGYRIEPAEIEAVLLQSGLVSQSVVIARENKEGDKRLIGYIIPQADFSKAAMLEYLHSRLPEYMVPDVWVELDALPLTPNGKVDKKALPEAGESELLHLEYVAPRNDTERAMAVIWQELLDLEKVGIHDDFFELGGHSLLAIRLISAIRRKLEVELTINYIFEYTTIAGLAGHLEAQHQQALLPPVEIIDPRPTNIPLSFSQERLWFIDQLEGSIQYHIPAVLRLNGNINKRGLASSIQHIINRHEVLRTVYKEQDGQAYQYVKDKDGWNLSITDNSINKLGSEALKEYVQQLINKPFDLSKDHMVRAELITLNELDHILVVTQHHIASDGWSLSILVKEIAELYNSFLEERQTNLPPLTIQYADYAIWQRKYLQGEVLNTKIDFWKKKLEGVTPLLLLTDRSRPTVQSNKGASANFLIEKELSENLLLLSQQQGATLFMTVLAAFKVLLYRYTGQQDICVGTSVANRNQQEIEGVIGFFVNILALRSEVNSQASFLELLKDVKATTMEAYSHQEAPFEKVVDAVVKERDLSRNP